MPSKRALKKYAIWYFDLISRAQDRAILIKTVGDPSLLRRDLYNFRSALREEERRDPTNERLSLARARAERLKFCLRTEGVLVLQSGTTLRANLEEYIIDE